MKEKSHCKGSGMRSQGVPRRSPPRCKNDQAIGYQGKNVTSTNAISPSQHVYLCIHFPAAHPPSTTSLTKATWAPLSPPPRSAPTLHHSHLDNTHPRSAPPFTATPLRNFSPHPCALVYAFPLPMHSPPLRPPRYVRPPTRVALYPLHRSAFTLHHCFHQDNFAPQPCTHISASRLFTHAPPLPPR